MQLFLKLSKLTQGEMAGTIKAVNIKLYEDLQQTTALKHKYI